MGAPVMCFAPDTLGMLLGVAYFVGAAFATGLIVWSNWMWGNKPDALKGGGE